MLWQKELRERLDELPTGMAFLGQADVWAIKSGSDPVDVHYIIKFNHDDGPINIICTCKGNRCTDHCYHSNREEVTQ